MCTNSSSKIGTGHRSPTFEIAPFVRCLLVMCVISCAADERSWVRNLLYDFNVHHLDLEGIFVITYLISERPYVSQLLHFPWTVAFIVFEIDCKHKSLEVEVCASQTWWSRFVQAPIDRSGIAQSVLWLSCGMDDRGIVIRFPLGTRELSPELPCWQVGPPSILFALNRGFFPCG